MNREHVSTAELVGRLGQKPELHYTSDNTPYVQLSVATSDGPFTDGGGEIREKTEWHRAVAWGDLATKIASDFDKGDSVALSGTLRINSYEKEGAKNRITELHVETADKNLDTKLSKNEARLVGVVREEPQSKEIAGGRHMTLVSLATKTMVQGKEREDWHSITVWGRAAEAAAREIHAGDTVAINGPLRHRTIGEEGHKRKLSAIECARFQVLERSVDRSQQEPAPAKDQDRAPAMAAAAEPARARGRQRGKGVERGM
jgi:single stranded DNA-binding protein